MKKSCKKIAAFTLSLAVIAGNAVNFLPNNNALTAKAAESVSEVLGKDESYYDAETETLHLKGYVRNGADGSGLVRPEGITGPITHLVADEGTVFPEDCSHLFEAICCYDIELRNADTSNVTDMSYMFCETENDAYFTRDYFDISTFDTSNVTNMEGMFMNFSGFYKDPDRFFEIFANFDTSSVTNMSKMFKGAGYLGQLPEYCHDVKNDITSFSSFDTSKVTDMSEMFADAHFLALDLTNFDTSNVTTISRMFENNWYLHELDISTFDTSNVTDMSYMFNKAYNWGWGSGVGNVDMSSFNTSKVTDMSYMFADTCIRSLDLSSFDTRNVTNMSHMFYGSEYLTSLDVSSFDTSRVKDMSYMFCRIGTFELDVRHFIISDDTNIDGMFIHSTRHGHEMYLMLPYGWTIEEMKEKDEYIFWTVLNELYISEFPDESYYDAETQTLHLKGYIRNNADGSGIKVPAGVDKKDIRIMTADEGTFFPKNCSHFCEGINGLEIIELQNADTSNVTDMSYMFCFAPNESFVRNRVILSNFDTSKVTNMQGMFKNCVTPFYDVSSFDTSNVTNMSEMFDGCGWVYETDPDYIDRYHDELNYMNTIDLSSFNTSKVTDMSGMFRNFGLSSLDLSSFDTSNVTDMSEMFAYSFWLYDLELGDFNTSNVTDMSGMFRNTLLSDYIPDTPCINSVDFSIFDTSSVTDMSCMFLRSRFNKLDLSGFDTSNVSDMSEMFSGSFLLESLDLSSFDTSNVPNMSGMFEGCYTLKALDLSSFDTSNVTDMNSMFRECYDLQTIIVGPNWSTVSAEGEYMFAYCISLVGGAGTVYDDEHTGIEYAHVDGGKKDPGYLTSVNNNTDKTIVIYVPEEAVDVATFLYDGIENPVVKDVISSAMDIISKYISIKVF